MKSLDLEKIDKSKLCKKSELVMHGIYQCVLSGRIMQVRAIGEDVNAKGENEIKVGAAVYNDEIKHYVLVDIFDNQLMDIG